MQTDITSVTYNNGPRFASVRIKVADLQQAGRVELIVTTTGGTDFAYVAKFDKKANGTVRKRLVSRDNAGDRPRQCTIKGRWAQDDDFVRVSVPQSCMPDAGRSHYMTASISLPSGNDVDYGPVAGNVKRG